MSKSKYIRLTYNDGRNVPQTEIWRVWEVQPPPFHSALQFSYEIHNVVAWSDSRDDHQEGPSCASTAYLEGETAGIINKCYDAFYNHINEQSQWANNALEAGGQLQAVAGHFTTLFKVAMHLKKGRFGDAMKDLGMDPSAKKRKNLDRAKNLGDAWLELHFGWQPLLQDIHNGISASINPPAFKQKIKTRVTDSYTVRQNNGGSDYDSFFTNNIHIDCKMGGICTVTNPNASGSSP
jgi:hypothetical protein